MTKDTVTLGPVKATSKDRARVRRLTRVFGPSVDRGTMMPVMGTLAVGREHSEAGMVVSNDAGMSRTHFRLVCVPGVDGVRLEDGSSKNGTFVNGRRVTSDFLSNGAVIRAGESLFVFSELPREASNWLECAAASTGDADCQVSLARAFAEAQAARAAGDASIAILITGPTGAGKEFLAKHVHEMSGRKGRLVAANCGGFTRDILAAELFGSVTGAFTSATDRPGLFEVASGSTLFLDEIAELPMDQQPMFLRVLQEGVIRRVGGKSDIRVDVRLVSATHQDLFARAEQGLMRLDLLARLAGCHVHLPGLADRREEILAFFARFLDQDILRMDLASADAMLRYAWPMNLRELKSVATRLRLMPNLQRIELDSLPPELTASTQAAAAAGPGGRAAAPSREVLQREYAKHGGNVSAMARTMQQHRTQVQRWLSSAGLAKGQENNE